MICDIELYQCTMSMGVPVLIILLASLGMGFMVPSVAEELKHFWKRDWNDKGDKP